ncbi:MAG: cytochrome c-type biogenesis CcmF C-terminal domain-containing protein [Actinomycetota bacterium]
MVYVGYVSLVLAAVAAIASVLMLYVRGNQTGNAEARMKLPYQTVYAIFGSVTVAALILLYGFIAKDYSFQYVADNSSADMTLFYRIAALWAGQEGSFLLWLWIISGAAALIAYFRSKVYDTLTSNALIVMGIVQASMLAYMLVLGNPFKISAIKVGLGMNPLLMHWAMVLHPPTLFVGYALMTVPFAYAVAAMVTRDASTAWVERSQRWTLVGWLFLTIGIFLGAAWAYVVLGWGGYWGWDPVENASLLPWLGGAALLHSFHIYRQRQSFKRWALSMSVGAFFMVIMAAFMTRSGVVTSVHSFEGSQAILTYFAAVIAATLGGSGYLLASRWNVFESKHIFESAFSRDALYHINNIVLLFCSAVILAGAFLPSITKQTLGPAVYNSIAQPLGVVFLLIVSICPLVDFGETNWNKFLRRIAIPGAVALISAVPWFLYWKSLEKMVTAVNPAAKLPANGWVGYIGLIVATFAIVAAIQIYVQKIMTRMSSGNEGLMTALGRFFTKTPGQAGGFITHLGLGIAVIGLVGSSMYTVSLPKTLPDKVGTSFKVGDMKFTYKGLTETQGTYKQIAHTNFDIADSSGRSLGTLAPEYVFYEVREQPGMNADIRYEVFRDVFIVFQGMNDKSELIFEVKINPLISFVWAGSIVLILGIMLAALPRRPLTQGK